VTIPFASVRHHLLAVTVAALVLAVPPETAWHSPREQQQPEFVGQTVAAPVRSYRGLGANGDPGCAMIQPFSSIGTTEALASTRW
jgi:hypothetical protein